MEFSLHSLSYWSQHLSCELQVQTRIFQDMKMAPKKKERKKIRETTTSWRHYTETLNLQKWYDMCCIICTQWKKVQPKKFDYTVCRFFWSHKSERGSQNRFIATSSHHCLMNLFIDVLADFFKELPKKFFLFQFLFLLKFACSVNFHSLLDLPLLRKN